VNLLLNRDRPEPPPTSARLMLVDDHPLVRDGLRARLESVPGFTVVAEAADAETAVAVAAQERPDVVLMDIGLRGVNGIEATRQILAQLTGTRVIVLSMHDAVSTIQAAMQAGASAYLLKDCPADDIVNAIQAVMAGQVLTPALLSDRSAQRSSPTQPTPHLTPRELDVLRLIAHGLSSKDIGERLGMGVRTVETHRTHLRRKLQLNSAAALVRYAIQHHGA
jgi:two-component system, NarL family, nitrate/nitrite response regulator NarL